VKSTSSTSIWATPLGATIIISVSNRRRIRWLLILAVKSVIPTESESHPKVGCGACFSVIEKRKAPKSQSQSQRATPGSYKWRLDRQVKDAPLLIDNIFKSQIID